MAKKTETPEAREPELEGAKTADDSTASAPRLDEAPQGGVYIVNGEYVNADGEPI